MKKTFSIPQRLGGDAGDLIFRPDSPWLAPLAGYSDLPFRLLCRELGAVVCETEMISARGLLYQTPGSAELLNSAPADYPLVVQLFGGDAASMAQALLTLRKKGYDAFDCNMGCPVRKVMRQNAGAALLREPAEALDLARAMLAAASTQGADLPENPAKLGFKLRLDPERKPHFLCDFGRALEDMGAAWLCLHPRTAGEGFGGSAHWRELERLRHAVSIPVIASGDLFTALAARDCLRATGTSCVMYGRGALANPFIFRQHEAALTGGLIPEQDREGLRALIERHIELAREYCGDRRAFVKMRSLIPRYARGFSGVNELRQRLCTCGDWEELKSALANFMERAGQ